MVVGAGGHGRWGEPGGGRLVVAQAGASGDQVEHLDDLGAETAGEPSVATECVLTGDTSLLVGGGPEWQVGDAELSVVGDHAVARGEDVGQVRTHVLVDDEGALVTGLGAGRGSQLDVGAHADNDQDHVDVAGERLSASGWVSP